jgi:hypothetical protein
MTSASLAATLKQVEAWPREAQDELAAYAAEIQAGLNDGAYRATREERAGIDRGLRDAEAGRLVDATALAEVIARHRPG